MTGQYSLAISNIGQTATGGDVSVTDMLPSGVSATKAAGSGWNCSVSPQVVNCDRSDSLPSGSQYSPIMLAVQVAPDSPVQLQDTATVHGGGEQNLSNDTASDATHIIIPPLPQLTISESADRTSLQVGDVITYTMLVTDASAVSAEQVELDSQVPVGFQYVKGTARVQAGSGTALSVDPQLHGSALVFQLGHMPAHRLITVSYRARAGANVRGGSYRDTASVSGFAPTGQHVGPASAQVAVNVGQSLMEVQRAALGRVYVDANGNSLFDKGESAVPGVRIYLSDGQSAITDSEGMYSFPSLPEGSVVMSIDPITMPSGYALSSESERQGESFTRLLRTPLGTGTVVTQNFALRAIPGMRQASLHALANEKIESKPPVENTAKMSESIVPVTPGKVVLVKPVADAPITSADGEIVTRVAAGWHVAIAVNGRPLDTSKVTPSTNKSTQTATFTLHTTELVPGPNKLRVTAIGPAGEKGANAEITVHRSGPAQRLEIVSDKPDVTANGRDQATLRVRAYDAWGKPAADAPITLETSRGQLRLTATSTADHTPADRESVARPALTPVAVPASMSPSATPIPLDLH
nr:hypothetical protein [Acidobacteriota bacterium]